MSITLLIPAGFYPTNHLDASVNSENYLYNLMTGNLGLYTAHQKKPGVHWSLLPQIHEEIKAGIHRTPLPIS